MKITRTSTTDTWYLTPHKNVSEYCMSMMVHSIGAVKFNSTQFFIIKVLAQQPYGKIQWQHMSMRKDTPNKTHKWKCIEKTWYKYIRVDKNSMNNIKHKIKTCLHELICSSIYWSFNPGFASQSTTMNSAQIQEYTKSQV